MRTTTVEQTAVTDNGTKVSKVFNCAFDNHVPQVQQVGRDGYQSNQQVKTKECWAVRLQGKANRFYPPEISNN